MLRNPCCNRSAIVLNLPDVAQDLDRVFPMSSDDTPSMRSRGTQVLVRHGPHVAGVDFVGIAEQAVRTRP